jgi:hypothetical protein
MRVNPRPGGTLESDSFSLALAIRRPGRGAILIPRPTGGSGFASTTG